MKKFIFVTGGVVSSLGKGIASASIGSIIEGSGLDVNFIKLDPYLNMDPGTMNPFEHGEVYVTDDGNETDLDLGHYERYVNVRMSKKNNMTSGKIFNNVLKKERKGGYLGQTVQIIPHLTDEIQASVQAVEGDVVIVEIGGTVGDIESLPFLEAIRQMRLKLGVDNTFFIHLTLVPYIASSQEIKTKPTQHSVKELRSIGIQPDMIICRCTHALSESQKDKIALFTNVSKQHILSLKDVNCVYKVPNLLLDQSINQLIFNHFNISEKVIDLSSWQEYIDRFESPKHNLKIGIVGKYSSYVDAYKSLAEALQHASVQNETKLDIIYIDSEQSEADLKTSFKTVNGLIIPGGFGERGIEGKIQAIRIARENNIPILGICLGMQLMVIEFLRNVSLLKDANSTEFNKKTNHPVIATIDEWASADQKVQFEKVFDGKMQLGLAEISLEQDSKVYDIYESNTIHERHRHRYGFNPNYFDIIEEGGLKPVGYNPNLKSLVEVVEHTSHPWFIGCQFHPEFLSTPRQPHPLFNNLIKHLIKHL
ncbi:MAG: CTP synthase [Gammaproteobacteria bacterium]|nr:CTP synthase [Gammaproteobacteria bacterium]